MFVALFFVLMGCGRLGDGEVVLYPPLDMTQMELDIDPVAGPLMMPLGWQEALSEPRNGFTLVPQALGDAGVCVESAFLLTIPPSIMGSPTLTNPLRVTIDGLPAPLLEPQGNATVLVTPEVPLSFNAVYTFRLAFEDADDITWTFQTVPNFALMGVLPAHESVNVPVDTGIELHFSLAGHGDVRPFFFIEPAVEGRFVQRGAVTVFMPTEPLEAGRIYTVTLAAGLGLDGTAARIDADVVFAFETAADADVFGADTSFHFNVVYTELPSFEPPAVRFRLNYPHRGTRPRVDIEVFRFGDTEDAAREVTRLFDTPRWAWHAWRNHHIDTAGLTRVARMNFSTPQNVDEWGWQETLVLPDALPPGFYLINASIGGDVSDQMLIQITDLVVQIFADDNQTLVWVNDMISGGAVQNATLLDAARTGQTNADGIAVLAGGFTDPTDRLVIETPDGKRLVIFYARHVQPQHFFRGFWGWGFAQPSAAYWSALQLDRTLFQRNDTVNFWGFVQNRNVREDISYVTAVLTEGWHWGRAGGMWGESDTLHRQTVPVQRGSYDGSIRLPHLDPGSYVLTIYHGDIVLNTVNFDVQDFVKPPYDIQISADRRAMFMWETVEFTVRSAFFEGTPVPDLALSYNARGWPMTVPHRVGHATTDHDGEATMTLGSFTAPANAQGRGNLNFHLDATLPEIGPTWRSHNVQVFINDIDVQVRATRDGTDANLQISAHTITLDRLNDGTAAHGSDFLCAPLVGQELNVEIVRVYWVATRIGERYCWINRMVVPRYRNDRREEVIERFTLHTDAQGEAARDFTVPDREGESYFARVSTTDGNRRTIQHNRFIGRDWQNFWWRTESGEPFLYSSREWDEGYDIGDEVHLTIMAGTERLERGNFLFVVASGGIVEYHVGMNLLAFTFSEEHLPNATVYAVFFDGHVYRSGWHMQETLRFNHQSRQLNFEITACQDSYRPGDTATVTVRVTDPSGRAVQTHVNLAAVDEALFALVDYDPRTLTQLYRDIPSGVRHRLATHGTFQSDGHEYVLHGGGARDTARYGMVTEQMDMALAAAPEAAADSGGAANAHIREIFEDTALFFSARTNAQGVATVTFRVPDNITSWRLTASGITDDLYAGNATSNLIVTHPLFVHYTLNEIFLTGDVPVLSVNAFGTALQAGTRVTYTVWADGAYTNGATATQNAPIQAEGYAFGRVDIPLWEMTQEGSFSILISATCENGLTDIVRHRFDVIDSHRLLDISVFYEVTEGTQFAPGGPGLTNITFTDLGRGRFLNSLLSVRHPHGARLELLVMRREANRMLQEFFPEVLTFAKPDNFNPLDYQRPDGSLSMLPYASGDLALTVRLMPFVMDDVNQPALRNFLYAALEDTAQHTPRALYGLALLGEPVLLHLHAFAQAQNLSFEDAVYLALAYAALGDTSTARELYAAHVAPHIIPIAPFYRVDGDFRHVILQRTSYAALLAAKLNMPERTGLHTYTARAHTDDLVVQVNQLAFIAHEITRLNDQAASVTYTLFGEEITRDLSGWNRFTLRIPTQNLHEFEIIAITGEVGAISTHRVPMEEIETSDTGVTINRQFFRAGETTPRTTFDQGDLIRVQITIDYSRTALTGSYIITDFLPAGLVHAPRSARFGNHATTPGVFRWATAEGQRVQFFDWNSGHRRDPNPTRVYYYYARVVNAGTFRAEGVVVQNMDAPGYMTVGEGATITIR